VFVFLRIHDARALITWRPLLFLGVIVKNRYSRQPETCLDPKPTFDFMGNERPCVVSKIEVDDIEVDDAGKKQSILNRVVDYALRIVA
jgi:hypothetical protein